MMVCIHAQTRDFAFVLCSYLFVLCCVVFVFVLCCVVLCCVVTIVYI